MLESGDKVVVFYLLRKVLISPRLILGSPPWSEHF